MMDGIIELGTKRAKEIGFTSDKFWGYLWQEDGTIIISFIESLHPGQGDFKRFCQGILAKGMAVEIPTPLGRMESIVRKAGYRHFTRPFHPPDIMDPVNVWRKEPMSQNKENHDKESAKR
jgi:hypothetical protein